MKSIAFTLLIFLNTILLFGQTLQPELLKYWYYRDRLHYFVYPGSEKGNSIVMTNRNGCKMYGDSYPPYFSIEYGQTHKLNGYYIGMLATEYKLLMINGQYTDAAATLHELDLALDALIRMDLCEMDAPWYEAQNSFDGFFIRDDVPAKSLT